jgi:ABC-type dipeptide/oligopeptide/nickel transport system permease component
MNWPLALTGSIMALPIGIPLGIISTVFLAQSRNEFK